MLKGDIKDFWPHIEETCLTRIREASLQLSDLNPLIPRFTVHPGDRLTGGRGSRDDEAGGGGSGYNHPLWAWRARWEILYYRVNLFGCFIVRDENVFPAGLRQILSDVIEEVRRSISQDIDGADVLHSLLTASWLQSLLKVRKCKLLLK